MTGVLAEVLLWVGGEILFWVVYFLFGFFFWMVVLPILLVTLTPVFLVRSLIGNEPFVAAMKRKYGRLIGFWKRLTMRFP
jgi:hypothetical protein